jgi:Ca2+-binding EF-hand superfamily protein
MDFPVRPPNYRYPPPNIPREYDPPPDGPRQIPQAPEGYQAPAFLVLKHPSKKTSKNRRKRSLFSDISSLPDLWNPNETPYGTVASTQGTSSRQKNNKKNKSRVNRRMKGSNSNRSRPQSATSSFSQNSSNMLSRPNSARSMSQESAISAYSVIQQLPPTITRRAKSAGRSNTSKQQTFLKSKAIKESILPTNSHKHTGKKWTANNDKKLNRAENRRKQLLANKVSQTRSFAENRGKRVNSEGEFVDGVVKDLRPRKEVPFVLVKRGKLLHRVARGVEEVRAENTIKDDEEMKKQVGGTEEMWMNSTKFNELNDIVDLESYNYSDEKRVQRERDDDEETEYFVEERKEGNGKFLLGPLCMQDIPEGRTPWYKMLAGFIPSDFLWKDLSHSIPLLELHLSHLNIDDRLLISLSGEESKHRGIIKLHLRHCKKITDTGVVALEQCKAIRDFDVCYCNKLTDVAFVSFARTHAELSRVKLTGCDLVTNKGIGALAVGCRRLILIEAAGLMLDDVALRAFSKQAGVPFSAKLQYVDLGGCETATDGSMMSVLTGLGGANYISIANAPLVTDVSMAPLSRPAFRSLRVLDITNAAVGDAGVAWIAAGCNGGLRELNLQGCKAVTDVAIMEIAEQCTNLTCLSLSECSEITDNSLNRLIVSLGPIGELNPYRHRTTKLKAKKKKKIIRRGGLRNIHDHEEDTLEDKYIDTPSGLRVLDISDCSKLTDRTLESIGQHCQCLETLVLVGVNNITDAGLLHLGRIRTRGVPATTRKGIRVPSIKPVNPLSTLNLSGRFTVSNVGLNTFFGMARVSDVGVARMLKQGCSFSMMSLDLTGSSFIGDATLRALAREGSPNLKHLALSGCAKITDIGISALAHSSCTNLETLNLAGCPRVGDGALIAIGTGPAGHSLRKLNLFKCKNITDKGIRELSTCTKLEELNIRTCINVTDGGLVAFASSHVDEEYMKRYHIPLAPRLISINLAGLPEITAAGVAALAKRFTRLCSLDATGCINVERYHLKPLVSIQNGVLPAARLAPNKRLVTLVPAAPNIGLQKLYTYFELKTKQHISARKIQTAWMNLCSFRAKMMAMVKEKMRKRKARKKACIMLQRTVARGVAGRMKAKQRGIRKALEDKSRIDIQRCFRGHLGRVIRRKRIVELKKIAALRFDKSIDIQRVWRGCMGRRKFAKKRKIDTKACIVLQGWVLGVWAKRHLKSLAGVRERLSKLRIRSAKIIQITWRAERDRKKARSKFVVLRHDTVKIQSWIRSVQSRLKTIAWKNRLVHSCIVVQHAFRSHEARYARYLLQKLKAEKEREATNAALSIQTFLVRPWFARRNIRLQIKKHQAATLFQSAWHYWKAKMNRRVNFAMERLRKREALIIEAKAREMYAIWRQEEDAKPDSLYNRQKLMLENGAALRIQKLYRRGLIRARLSVLGKWRYHRAAIQIQSFVRGSWARIYVKWWKSVIQLVTYRIKKWWRQFPITYAYRNTKKIKEAELRRLALVKKKELIQQAWDRRYAHLLERTKLRSCRRIQFEYRAYVLRCKKLKELEELRMLKEAEVKAIEDYRIMQKQERAEKKTLRYKFKRFKKFITDPKALRKHYLPDKRQVDRAVDQVKSMFDPKLREKLVRAEFESLMFSIQARQKEAIAQTGVVEIELTVGEDRYKSFSQEQHLAMKEGRSYYVTNLVDIHSTHTKLSEGQHVPNPRFIFIWTMTANDRTSHVITDIQITKRPPKMNSLRLREYLDSVKDSGWIMKWDPKCNFEIRYRKDGRHMIRSMEVVKNERQQAKYIKTGWEVHSLDTITHEGKGGDENEDQKSGDLLPLDFKYFHYDSGCKLFLKHALPKKNSQALEAHYEAVKRSDGTYGDISQDSMDDASIRRLVDQVEFAGYTAIDIDKLRRHFNKMDNDESGTVDVDEFFEYINENRTILSQHIFEFHGFEFGVNLKDEELDFGHFVKAITTMCMFDTNLLVRFFFNIFDVENKRYIMKTEARQLLTMFQHQAPGVCTRGQMERACLMLGIIGSGAGQGGVTFEDFLELAHSCPTVVYPILKFQHALRTKFLGVKYWEKKLLNMEKARKLVVQARNDGIDVVSGDVTGKLMNMSEHREQKKKVEARKKKLAHWKDTNRQGRKGGENKIVNVV